VSASGNHAITCGAAGIGTAGLGTEQATASSTTSTVQLNVRFQGGTAYDSDCNPACCCPTPFLHSLHRCLGGKADDSDADLVRRLFEAVGKIYRCEKHCMMGVAISLNYVEDSIPCFLVVRHLSGSHCRVDEKLHSAGVH